MEIDVGPSLRYQRSVPNVCEEVAFECRRCTGVLAASRGPRSQVTYYSCAGCGLATNSADPIAFRRAARVVQAPTPDDPELREWRRRLDVFNVRADDTDPFARLGLPPTASFAEARERFHVLAMTHHPDRGGEADLLRGIIEAFDCIRDRVAQGRQGSGEARPAAAPAARKYVLARRRPESWGRWSPARAEAMGAALAKRGL